jgi:hypothetical protein
MVRFSVYQRPLEQALLAHRLNDNTTWGQGIAARRDFEPAYDRCGVKLGHSAMSA